MKGAYNGAYMRRYTIVPTAQIRAAHLSKDALRRLTWIDWYFSHGKHAEATCRHFSLSKSVFYRWLNRFDRYNLKTLEFDTKTRRPKTVRQMTTKPTVLQQIYDIRQEDVEKSKWEIHEELQRQGTKVAHNVIQKVINRHPELQALPHKRSASKKHQQAIARVKADRSLRDKGLGVLVQMDTKHLYVAQQRFYLFVAVDCKSRYAFVWCYSRASSKNAADFLKRVQACFPFVISASNTDNGPEYLKDFHAACTDGALTHYFTYPYTPKMNGRAERMIKTVTYEFFQYQCDLLPTVAEINKRCAIFNDKYNNRRFHQALGYQTPAEYVRTYQQLKGGQPFSI